jgi:hypothetical protein
MPITADTIAAFFRPMPSSKMTATHSESPGKVIATANTSSALRSTNSA